ncbi:PREDICTED: odorant receptor 49b-like [Dinoponera quadriceps]|uniref:Odorant receptor n=1 Tax=Dinoponera quadriceps TaxID=609295 RepID=A0A6P3Y8L2_DINQU|nr:PREDICTED: odorant receptor 49b-like [Dinoponera quadriceps]
MQEKVTLKKVIAVVKLSVFVIWFWPLPQNSSKRKLLCMKLYQFVSMILTIAVIASMLYALVKNLKEDLNLVIKSALGLFPSSHVIWNIWCHIFIYQRLQCVTFEMESFCALIEPHEEVILQRKYINKCASFYGFCIASYYMTLFALFVGPFVLDQPLPAPADFPFDASHQPLRTITYLHQIVVGLQIAAHLSINAFMALLLWVVSARFRLLTEDIREIANTYDFVKCIEKHQHLLKYAREVAYTVRPFALGTVFFSTVSLIVFGLILITGASLPLKIQFIFLAFSALSEVFMYAWPAEHLIHISSDVAHAAFETNWYDGSNNLRKNLQMIILRSQKPIVVALPCGLPSLSLRYYASYLSTIFSYFTTMRIMFEEQSNEI